jgi:hypothetical protein
VRQDNRVCVMAMSSFIRDFRGVDGVLCCTSGHCEPTELLPLIQCLTGGILNKGGVGLVKNLLGGVKGWFCSQGRSVTTAGPQWKTQAHTGKGRSVAEEIIERS